MYSIFDLDLYLYNNIFWDTRPQKMKNILYNNFFFPRDYYIREDITDDKKRNIKRIYFDIIRNINENTIRYYTSEEWKIISSMTNDLKYLYNIKNFDKLIPTSDGVCEIIRLAILHDNKGTEYMPKEFWKCLINLCHNCDFRLFFHKNIYLNKSEYFTNLIKTLFNEIIKTKENQIKFESLVTSLFYIYKMVLDNKRNSLWYEPEWNFDVTLEFPKEIVEKIQNVKNEEYFFNGKFLLDLIDYEKRSKELELQKKVT